MDTLRVFTRMQLYIPLSQLTYTNDDAIAYMSTAPHTNIKYAASLHFMNSDVAALHCVLIILRLIAPQCNSRGA